MTDLVDAHPLEVPMSSPMSLPELLGSAGIPVTAGALVDLPPGAPEWVRYVFVFAGAVVAPFLLKAAPPVVRAYLAGRRAKKASLALAKHRRAAERRQLAARLEDDANTANDADAKRLRELADRDEDEADALEADAAAAAAVGAHTSSAAVPALKPEDK